MMKLSYIVAAVAAAFATSAVAGGGQMYQSQSQDSSNWGGTQRVSTQSASPRVVQEAQQELNKMGYDAGPANGQMNARTEQSVKQFQSAQNLSPTGEINGPTLAALGIARNPAPGTAVIDSSSSAGIGNSTNRGSSRPFGSHAPQD
jgi:peptidoglycan hydrolase-like protein with peptidoglycan-binding domain